MDELKDNVLEQDEDEMKSDSPEVNNLEQDSEDKNTEEADE